VWVVDPIDGTNEFVRGTPEFAISVGLVHQGSVVLGCVVNPASGEGGVGQVGGGVEFWGGLKQRPSETRLSAASASVSRTETNDGTVLPYLGLVGTPLIVGSVAYKLLRTAAGHDDMTFSVQHKSEWDICGGVALLEAAGKVYRRLDGEPLRFNQGSTRVTSGAVAGESVLVEIFLVDMEQLASSLGKSLASP
jgi:myo-inositol-1(or 4)-monophosphatase